MKGKTLGTIVLGLAIGLGGCGGDSTETSQQTTQVQSQDQIRKISGEIVDIDEDSLAVGMYYAGANFEIEHMRIKASNGKIYRLLFPGPSNYQVGDKVDFQYKEQSRISFEELLKSFEEPKYNFQNGYFDIDGIIMR